MTDAFEPFFLKAFGPLISLMSWEWTNRNAANRHRNSPGIADTQNKRMHLFLLAVEVFLLTVPHRYLRCGNRK